MSSNFSADDLKELEIAIAKGVKTVKYTDKEVTYRSLDEMLRVRDIIKECLAGDDSLEKNGRGTRRVACFDKGI